MPCFFLSGDCRGASLWFVSYCIFFGALLLSNNCIQGAFAIKLGKQIKESNFIGNPFFELRKDSSNTDRSEMTTPGSSVIYPKYMDMIGQTPLIDISSLVRNPKCPGMCRNLGLHLHIYVYHILEGPICGLFYRVFYQSIDEILLTLCIFRRNSCLGQS